jgi:hypothetical protein
VNSEPNEQKKTAAPQEPAAPRMAKQHTPDIVARTLGLEPYRAAPQEPAEDAAHGRCANWLRHFIFKHKRDPYPQEVWDAAQSVADAQDARRYRQDAMRYRWLRDNAMEGEVREYASLPGVKWDSTIDADIARDAAMALDVTKRDPKGD